LAVGWWLAVGSWQLAVGSRQLAVGSWQLVVVVFFVPGRGRECLETKTNALVRAWAKKIVKSFVDRCDKKYKNRTKKKFLR
jgi:hypothetical protein